MGKLYPPYINGTLPAFDINNNTIKIAFEMNRSVNSSDVNGFAILVKTAAQNTIILSTITSTYNIDEGYTIFTLTDEQMKMFNIGQSYKVQLAYIGHDGVIGYYSTIGVIKCTVSGIAKINEYDKNSINLFTSNLIGTYSLNAEDAEKKMTDLSEKEYSYSFVIYNMKREILYNSGELIHNNSLDTDNTLFYDTITINNILDDDSSYLIQYSVTTLNGLVVTSPLYQIINTAFFECANLNLQTVLDYDNGYVNLLFSPIANQSIIGTYNLMRRSKSSNGDYSEWIVINKFTINNDVFTPFNIQDFTIEQGLYYQYGIQQYNTHNIATKINTVGNIDCVYGDFEDMFLYDGEKQLRIRYNPKVSSFKATKQTSKIETIGSKYPYIFANGSIDYKEFSIEGLVSYQMDTLYCFHKAPESYSRKSTNSDGIGDFNRATDLSSVNMQMEREFKLNILDWLNNGKPKLFRSASEGNYIVTIMNTSFTPDDKLSRMLHTFKSTAYEIAEYNYTNLLEYGFLAEQKTFNKYQIVQYNKQFSELRVKGQDYFEISEAMVGGKILAIQIDNADPGTIIQLYNDDDNKANYVNIMIGLTGSYYYNDLDESLKTISKIRIKPVSNSLYDATLTITYKTLYVGNSPFDHISAISLQSRISHQIKGYNYSNNIIPILVPGDSRYNHYEIFKIHSVVFRRNIINMLEPVLQQNIVNTNSNPDYQVEIKYINQEPIIINLLEIDEIIYDGMIDFALIESIKIGNKVLAEFTYQLLVTTYDSLGYTNYGKADNLNAVYAEIDEPRLIFHNVPIVETEFTTVEQISDNESKCTLNFE